MAILKLNKQGMFVSWMKELPKRSKYIDGATSTVIRTNDIRRCIQGERKTAGGYQWIETVDLTKK